MMRFSLRSPIMPASGTFGYGDELLGVIDYSVLGAIVTKGISLKPRAGNPPPRITSAPCGLINSIGLQNVGVEGFIKRIPALLRTETPIIVNIFGESEEEYAEVISALDKTPVFGFELNLSCPNVSKGGIEFGTDPKAVAKVVSLSRRKTEKFLSAKFPPYLFILPRVVEVALSEGADAVVLTNTIPACTLDSGKFIKGGLSGRALRPISLRCVLEVSETIGSAPIIGCGGVFTSKDALEYMKAGAKAVQVGTAALSNPKNLEKIYHELDHEIAGI